MAKILIIEDDPYVLRLYERLFKHSDYDVQLASSGKEGLEFARLQKPNLILLDILMPAMNGLEVLGKLKEDKETKDCEVIMLTNLDDNSEYQKAMKLGASGFIVKSSAPPEKLMELVEGYLAKQGKNG
jgi:CheY-like chemotaxis protein